jgi:hypothetical protein
MVEVSKQGCMFKGLAMLQSCLSVWLDLGMRLALSEWLARSVVGSWHVLGSHWCGSLLLVSEVKLAIVVILW